MKKKHRIIQKVVSSIFARHKLCPEVDAPFVCWPKTVSQVGVIYLSLQYSKIKHLATDSKSQRQDKEKNDIKTDRPEAI